MNTINKIATGALSLVALAAPAAAQHVLALNHVFSGISPAGTAPWLTLKFEDQNATTVRFTMDAAGLTDQEFVSAWYVNFNPALSATGLNFSIVSNPTNLTLSKITTGTNAFKADGDGKYDVLFDFPPPPGTFSAKFTAGEKVIVDVSRASGLSTADFLYQSVESSGNGVYFTAAHIQGIGIDNEQSAWVGATAIPEPSTYAIMAGGFVLGYIVVRRRNANSHKI